MSQTQEDGSVFNVPFHSSRASDAAYAAHLRLTPNLKQELLQAASAGQSVFLRFQDGCATLTLGKSEFTLQCSKETNCDVVQLPENRYSDESCVELGSIKLKLNVQRTLDDTLKNKIRAREAEEQLKQRQAVMLAKGHKGSGKVTKTVTRQMTPPIQSTSIPKPPVHRGLTPVLQAPKEVSVQSLPPAPARKPLEPPRPNSKKPGGGQGKRALAGSPAKPVSRAATPPLSTQSTPTRGLTPPPESSHTGNGPAAMGAVHVQGAHQEGAPERAASHSSGGHAAASAAVVPPEIPRAAISAAAAHDVQMCVAAILQAASMQLSNTGLNRAINEAYRLAKQKPEKKEYLARVIKGACELVPPNRIRLKPDVLEKELPKIEAAAAAGKAGGGTAAATAAAGKAGGGAASSGTGKAGVASAAGAAAAGKAGASMAAAAVAKAGVGNSNTNSPATTRSVSPPPRLPLSSTLVPPSKGPGSASAIAASVAAAAAAAASAATKVATAAAAANKHTLVKQRSLNAIASSAAPSTSGSPAVAASGKSKTSSSRGGSAAAMKRAREPASSYLGGSSETESDSEMMVIPRGGSEGATKVPKGAKGSGAEPQKKRARPATGMGNGPKGAVSQPGPTPAPAPAPQRASAPPPPPPLSKLPPPPQLSQMKGTVQSAVPVPPPPLSQQQQQHGEASNVDDRNSTEQGTATGHHQHSQRGVSTWAGDGSRQEGHGQGAPRASHSRDDSDGQVSSGAHMARTTNKPASAGVGSSQRKEEAAAPLPPPAARQGAPSPSPAPDASPSVAAMATPPPPPQDEETILRQMIAAGDIDEDDVAYARLPYLVSEDADLESDLEPYVSSPSAPREHITTAAEHAALRSEYNQKYEVYFKVHQKYNALMSEIKALATAASADGVSEAKRKAWRQQLWALGACNFMAIQRWESALSRLQSDLSAIRSEASRFLASYQDRGRRCATADDAMEL